MIKVKEISRSNRTGISGDKTIHCASRNLWSRTLAGLQVVANIVKCRKLKRVVHELQRTAEGFAAWW